jgi:Mg2+-importing ATPase
VRATDGLAQKCARLRAISTQPAANLFDALGAGRAGLLDRDAEDRLAGSGPNEVARERPPAWYVQLFDAFKNPFNAVLTGLAAIELWSSPDDVKAPIIIGVMIAISVGIRFAQEFRSGRAAERLKALVRTTATVLRRVDEESPPTAREVPVRDLVRGDLVSLAAGDMIPADVRVLSDKDLFVNQGVLTGESLPIEKTASPRTPASERTIAQELPNVALMGTNVVSGTATALVVTTGRDTYFGSVASGILGRRALTSFDVGVAKITWLLIRFIGVMAPVVLLLNGFTKHDWKEASFFAISVAVGLVPEMLALVVTANLARGAIAMSKKKVVVKRLNAIQTFGAMDVLCTDKTGTLTQDRVVLEQHVDVVGLESPEVLRLAYLNSYHQTGLRNLLDRAVLERGEKLVDGAAERALEKVDEVPFDFMRRRMSVVVATADGGHLLVCKGAIDEVLQICDKVEIAGEVGPVTPLIRKHVERVAGEMNQDGLRVIAVAYRKTAPDQRVYCVGDECTLTLAGYIGFLDPPRDSAQPALEALAQHGIAVKLLTGDNEIVARKICREVGLRVEGVLRGGEIDALDEEALSEAAGRTTLFAKLNPLQKSRVVRVLKGRGHTVGFLGDGINDAPAVREADIGISVDTAVDIAKESADIILLEKSLMALEQGVLEGRTTFGNMMKYLKMTASSNFGNVFSVLIASAFLPFLPMLPIQLLIQNLLYDISQLSIPWDRMDESYLRTPRRWDANRLRNFMLFIGPISSIFDVTTFAVMWFAFGANAPARQALFQSGWFVEGLLSQTLIVHMIRTEKIPLVQSRAAPQVVALTTMVMAAGIALPFSPIGAAVGLRPLPGVYFAWLVAILLGYCVLTQRVKRWYIRRFDTWL